MCLRTSPSYADKKTHTKKWERGRGRREGWGHESSGRSFARQRRRAIRPVYDAPCRTYRNVGPHRAGQSTRQQGRAPNVREISREHAHRFADAAAWNGLVRHAGRHESVARKSVRRSSVPDLSTSGGERCAGQDMRDSRRARRVCRPWVLHCVWQGARERCASQVHVREAAGTLHPLWVLLPSKRAPSTQVPIALFTITVSTSQPLNPSTSQLLGKEKLFLIRALSCTDSSDCVC